MASYIFARMLGATAGIPPPPPGQARRFAPPATPAGRPTWKRGLGRRGPAAESSLDDPPLHGRPLPGWRTHPLATQWSVVRSVPDPIPWSDRGHLLRLSSTSGSCGERLPGASASAAWRRYRRRATCRSAGTGRKRKPRRSPPWSPCLQSYTSVENGTRAEAPLRGRRGRTRSGWWGRFPGSAGTPTPGRSNPTLCVRQLVAGGELTGGLLGGGVVVVGGVVVSQIGKSLSNRPPLMVSEAESSVSPLPGRACSGSSCLKRWERR